MNTTTSRIPKNSKPKIMTNVSNSTTALNREHIAICAYYIWEEEDRPDAREIIHWLRAEIQLQGDPETHAETLKT